MNKYFKGKTEKHKLSEYMTYKAEDFKYYICNKNQEL